MSYSMFWLFSVKFYILKANFNKGRTYSDTDYRISNKKIYYYEITTVLMAMNGGFHDTFSADHKSLV